jgi:CRP/FNR family cyclic AMP-dependent transcriptional regulator
MVSPTPVNASGPLRTPEGWFELGHAIYSDVVGALGRYGAHLHPDLRFVPANSPTPYYEPATLTIGFGIPDPTTAKGRLYWYFVQHLVAAGDLLEVQEAMEVPLPWSVTHEVIHHLRHHYQAPIANDFIEEQVVNCIAIALLSEHPRYRDGLSALKHWANRIFAQTRPLSPDTAPYLAGFRLDVPEVLVAQGVVERQTLVEARHLAEETNATVEDVLVRTGWIAQASLNRAAAERTRAETYFNGRYMASLSEYWLFGTEWLARYLERDDLLSTGRALERYLLTDDWEASQHEAITLLLEQGLRSTDPAISTTAAESLAAHEDVAAIPALLAALADPRPSVQVTVLNTLCRLPGGPNAGVARARELLAGNDDVGAASARLLRLAGTTFTVPQGASPGELAQWALARIPDDPATAYQRLGALLEMDERAVLAALDALREAGAGPLADRVMRLLDSGSAAVRASAVTAVADVPAAAPALVARLGDDEPAVRYAAQEALRHLGQTAVPALVAIPPTAPDVARVEALCLAARISEPEAHGLLLEISAALQRRAQRLARLEAQVAGHQDLDILVQALGEERRRLAQLSVRAVGQVLDPAATDLAERALDSPDPAHRASGRDVVRHALGRRGRSLSKLLSPETKVVAVGTIDATLAACAAAESPTIRALAAFFASRVLALAEAQGIVHRLSSDSERLVQDEVTRIRRGEASAAGTTMLTTIEKLMILRGVPTFAGCEIETLRRVAERFVVQRFAPGEVILREGEPGQSLYVVAEGQVAITAGGRQLDNLASRQYFGEMALFDSGPRSATATALEATTVLRLDRDDFYRLGRETPDLLPGVICVLSQRLRVLMARVAASEGVPKVDG